MKLKSIILITFLANAITIIPLILNQTLYFISLLIINSMMLGFVYQSYIYENNFNPSKIKNLNFMFTLIGILCFFISFIPNIEILTYPASQLFGTFAGFLIINKKYERNYSHENH